MFGLYSKATPQATSVPVSFQKQGCKAAVPMLWELKASRQATSPVESDHLTILVLVYYWCFGTRHEGYQPEEELMSFIRYAHEDEIPPRWVCKCEMYILLTISNSNQLRCSDIPTRRDASCLLGSRLISNSFSWALLIISSVSASEVKTGWYSSSETPVGWMKE